LSALAGVPIESTMVSVSNLSLFLVFVLLILYADGRGRDGTANESTYVPLSFGLYPGAVFCHMAYAESVFLAFGLLAFVGMQRRWRTLLIATFVAAATATRPVGIVLVIPFVMYLWALYAHWRRFITRAGVLLPVCMSGLAAYSIGLWWMFDEPLAFVWTQRHWSFVPDSSYVDRGLSVLSFEPFWGYFDPDSPFHPSHFHNQRSFGHYAPFMDRLLFAFAVSVILLGWRKRWLDAREVAFCAGLLTMSYLTRGYDMCFFSQGRFTVVAFPIYVAWARILSDFGWIAWGGIVFSTGALFTMSASLLMAGYFII
jgi:hypothetical protein